MIDIDDIYEACRMSHQQLILFKVNMIVLREVIGRWSVYLFGPGSVQLKMPEVYVPDWNHRDITLKAQTLIVNPRPFEEFDPRREKRKAQWKDETRMRNGRNWKR